MTSESGNERGEPIRSKAKFDVAVLFYNRAHQTLACVLSFLNEDVQPDIIILNQGSAADQRKLLDAALGQRPNVRFIDLTENIGVAAGRNRLCRACSADWILFVDNDIFLNSLDGVALLNSAVEQARDADGLLPRLLNVHDDRVVVRMRLVGQPGERLKTERLGPYATATNIFSGGAAILRRAFLLDQPYDEKYFVGFEDFELAARRFVADKPLRIEKVEQITLVHKHMPVSAAPDIAATQTRYNVSLIDESFNALNEKFGSGLFAGWRSWVDRQRHEMIAPHPIKSSIARSKLNITVLVDMPEWAFDTVAKNLARCIGEGYVVTILYANDPDDGQVLRLILESSPDIIHVMWRAYLRRLLQPAHIERCAELMGLSKTEILDRFCQCHLTFTVSDHLLLDKNDIESLRPLYWLADGYCVQSPILADIYARIADYPRPMAMTPNGIDLTLYHPPTVPRLARSTIKIGWVGNSDWGKLRGLVDVKGLNTIIRPAFELLRQEGLDVELLVCDRVKRWRSREEVALLYRDVDIYVCASSMEGMPNPVLEAMASGIAVVSTRVGVVPYVFGPLQQSFIIERSVEALAEALRRLCREPALREQLAQENLREIQKHSWATRADLWRKFFSDVVRNAHPDAPNWRRLMIEKHFVRAKR